MRNQLKALFRGDFNGSSTYRMYNPARLMAGMYIGSAAEMLAAAARTSGYFNDLGVTAIVGGVGNEMNAACECGK